MGDSESEDRLTTLVDPLDLFEEERLSERCEFFVDEGKGKESLAVKPRLTMQDSVGVLISRCSRSEVFVLSGCDLEYAKFD